MAKAKPAAVEESGQGRAVTLPNGKKRIEFIRDRFYNDGKTRSEVKTQINEMLDKAGRGEEQIPYQIVFAATKDKDTDPRIASVAAAEKRQKDRDTKTAAAKKEKDAADAKAAKTKGK